MDARFACLKGFALDLARAGLVVRLVGYTVNLITQSRVLFMHDSR